MEKRVNPSWKRRRGIGHRRERAQERSKQSQTDIITQTLAPDCDQQVVPPGHCSLGPDWFQSCVNLGHDWLTTASESQLNNAPCLADLSLRQVLYSIGTSTHRHLSFPLMSKTTLSIQLTTQISVFHHETWSGGRSTEWSLVGTATVIQSDFKPNSNQTANPNVKP